MKKKLTALLLSVLVLTGCAVIEVADYDPFLHQSLNELKTETVTLYQTLKTGEINEKGIEQVKSELQLLQDYAKSKADGNSETIKELEIVAAMFARHVENRVKTGPWSERHCLNLTELIGDAYDRLIRLELSKSKGSR